MIFCVLWGWLLTAGLWVLALEAEMKIDLSGIQTELDLLSERATAQDALIAGITQDYQSQGARIEALEAALGDHEPAAIQAAIEALKNQAAAVNAKLAQHAAAMETLDASVPPPPSPPGT